jgi:uncharacterized protein
VGTQVELVVIENFGSCNLRCAYCFPEHMWARQGHSPTISEETYRGILERTFSTTTAETVDIHFAGGEPLLAGQEWLEGAMRLGRDIAARHDKGATFSLQTNATLVTRELARVLAENRVRVGVSLDGDTEINDEMRGGTAGALRGFRYLAETYGRPPGVIVTVTHCNARRMRDVVRFVDNLGVTRFRANQMGATASWNEHAAPRAEEWATAREDVFEEIASRRGRIMEHNLSQTVTKLVHSLLEGTSPFDVLGGCCASRCTAGRGLAYFDQRGNAYPCPRSNVTPQARIGHYADEDFDARWHETERELDAAMSIPSECRRCPAQLVCDYGCHAFNVADGNFFEVNCDATKDYFGWLQGRLDDVARIFLYIRWRERLEASDDHGALRGGVDLPARLVSGLADRLRRRLADRLSSPELSAETLERRYGWRDALVPVGALTRPRVSQPPHARRAATPRAATG